MSGGGVVKNVRGWTLILSGVGLIAPSAAMAQEARRFDLGLHARVEHNSNVARSNSAQAAARGLSLSDTLFTPSATVDVFLPVGRRSVFLRGVAGYTFYEKNDKLNRERLDVSGGVNSPILGPCQGVLTGGYSRGINQIDDPTLIENVENIQDTKRLGLNVNCAGATGLGLVASVSKDWTENSLDFLESSDAERTSYMAGVSYSRPALGTLTVFGNRDETEYPKRLLGGGYEMNSVGVTLERKLGARIQGSVTVAYASVEQKGLEALLGHGDMHTNSYAADLTYRVSDRLRLQANLARSVTPASGFGRTYDLTESYRLAGDYDLGSRITVSVGASKVDREAGGVLPDPVLQLTDSTTKSFSVAVRYRQSERLSFVLSGGREDRTTNSPEFDYENNRIGVSADLEF
jgi:Uncharacterized protein conserved in bacteria (DUF2320).